KVVHVSGGGNNVTGKRFRMPTVGCKNCWRVSERISRGYPCPHLPFAAVMCATKPAEVFVDRTFNTDACEVNSLTSGQAVQPVFQNTVYRAFGLRHINS